MRIPSTNNHPSDMFDRRTRDITFLSYTDHDKRFDR
jgi:hypothetical protein